MFIYGLTGSKFREEAQTVPFKLRYCLTDGVPTSNNRASESVSQRANRPTGVAFVNEPAVNDNMITTI